MNTIIEILNNAGIVQGFFLAFLLFYKKSLNKNANKILAVLLFVFSISILHSLFADSHFENLYKSPFRAKEPFVLLVAPMLWFYVKEITLKSKFFSFKTSFHFLPFIAFFILMIPFLIYGSEFPSSEFIYRNSLIITIIAWLAIILQFSLYFQKILIRIKIHRKNVKQELANIDKVSLDWVKFFMFVFLFFYLFVIVTLFALIHFGQFAYFNQIISLIFTVSIFMIGYKGLFQKEINIIEHDKKIKTEVTVSNKEETNSKQAGTEEEKQNIELAEKLQIYMIEKKPYLDSELTLTNLARNLSVSRNRLSHIINNYVGDNFYDFVNKYRVEEFKQLYSVKSNKKFTILALAYDAGFASKSSFNRVFKKITGQTPSEYQKAN